MGVLQVFFAPPVGAAAVPAVETLLSTTDQAERPAEHVALVTTDAGFMHAREQYPRWVPWPGTVTGCVPLRVNCGTGMKHDFFCNLAGVQFNSIQFISSTDHYT
jgi:hypothetical protein